MHVKSGFITPPWPHTRGDSVSALSLIDRISKEAHRGCGLYYEIYHYRALNELLRVLDNLSASDTEVFRDAAINAGFQLDGATVNGSHETYQQIMKEIRSEQL